MLAESLLSRLRTERDPQADLIVPVHYIKGIRSKLSLASQYLDILDRDGFSPLTLAYLRYLTNQPLHHLIHFQPPTTQLPPTIFSPQCVNQKLTNWATISIINHRCSVDVLFTKP